MDVRTYKVYCLYTPIIERGLAVSTIICVMCTLKFILNYYYTLAKIHNKVRRE